MATRPSASARAMGSALTVLVHLLIGWALLAPSRVTQEAAAALPPLRVSLLGAPPGRAAPAPIEAVPPLPEPVLILPDLRVEPTAPSQPVVDPVPQPVAAATVATAPPARDPSAGAGPQLRRSDGRTPDCLLPAWLALISQAISFSQRYPADARQVGASGTAYVRLSVARNGRVMASPLLQSSGHASLDLEARDVVRRIGRFAPVPPTACVGYDVIVVDQPIRFGS